jgi:hypothetical protein
LIHLSHFLAQPWRKLLLSFLLFLNSKGYHVKQRKIQFFPVIS